MRVCSDAERKGQDEFILGAQLACNNLATVSIIFHSIHHSTIC